MNIFHDIFRTNSVQLRSESDINRVIGKPQNVKLENIIKRSLYLKYVSCSSSNDYDIQNSSDDDLRRKKMSRCYSFLSILPLSSFSKPIVPKRILIIEDSDITRMFLYRLLKGRGHHCEVAEDGLIGLNMFKGTEEMRENDLYLKNYDFILINYLMPIMDGVEATTQIRNLGYKGTIIGLTSIPFDEEIGRFFHAGVNYVFSKPFQMIDINFVIDL